MSFKGFSLAKTTNGAIPKVNLIYSSAAVHSDESKLREQETDASTPSSTDSDALSKKRRWDVTKDLPPAKQLKKLRENGIKQESANKAQIVGEPEGEEGEKEIDALDDYVSSLTSSLDVDSTIKQKSTTYPDHEDDLAEKEDDRATLLANKLASIANPTSTRKDVPVIDHSTVDYEPFNKKFYVETPDIARLGDAEVHQLRSEFDNIQVHGVNVPKPIVKWSQAGLDVRTLTVMSRQNYTSPTAIQAQAIPAIMSGRDVIGIAETGSGKTLAYVLPLLRHICDQRPVRVGEGPIALVLAPTRELAEQVYNEFKRFSDPLKLKTVRVYGGVPLSQDLAQIKPGCHILVATTGRLIDLLTTGRNLSLKRVTCLILDEADRMFDMGFEPQVMKIVQNIRPDRQTVLFSATFPRQMEALARRILTNPIEIVVGGKSVVCNNVHQLVEVRTDDSKFYRLLEILGQWMDLRAKGQDTSLLERLSINRPSEAVPIGSVPNRGKALIFVSTQDLAATLFSQLTYKGYICQMLHGGMDQMDREDVLRRFKKIDGDLPVLIATSVAARGLDVKHLSLVVNFSCPNHSEDYVHRCGRTGRAGAIGTAITFVTEEDDKYASDIVKALQESKNAVPEDLKALQKSFAEKVKSGQATKHGSGFGGKGLEKIDKDREANLKAQKQKYGVDEEVREEEKEEATAAAAEVPEGNEPSEGALTSNLSAEVNSVMKAAQERAAALNLNMGLTMVEPTKQSMPMPVPVKRHTFEVEINDLPQIVRFRLTHRDTLSRIEESTHTALTVRGEYGDKDKVMVAGKRKLYIYVEAEEKQHVDFAVAQIRQFIDEQILSSSASSLAYSGGNTGGTSGSNRYTVV